MRTAHIITRDSKSAKLITDGLFTDVMAKFKSLEPKPGESVEFWSSGNNVKVKSNHAPVREKADK